MMNGFEYTGMDAILAGSFRNITEDAGLCISGADCIDRDSIGGVIQRCGTGHTDYSESVSYTHLLLAGVGITVPDFSLENQVTLGILWGLEKRAVPMVGRVWFVPER